MRIDVLTLFPDVFAPLFSHSIVGRAVAQGQVELAAVDIRRYAQDRHRSVDDTPYGGGPGMVLRVDVLARAITAVRSEQSHVVLLSPAGPPLVQETVVRLAGKPHLVLVAGHYEGVDQRIESVVDEQISLGDFILSGGEAAAWAVVDAITRCLPGVISAESLREESFSQAGLLEAPQFTRPRRFGDLEVPAELLTGDHQAVAAWRQREALRRTWLMRPDLLQRAELTPWQRALVESFEQTMAAASRLGRGDQDGHENSGD